ncbi:MAG: DUF4202 family protein [Deltaproteobacteria bacterium]|nr:DUF4202 family protein [Deltaproteobacteria bacterium]
MNELGKTADGPISRYLNRPVSLLITRYLSKTRITPNQITFFSFLLSVAGAIFFMLGGYPNLVVGAVLAHASSVVDGCDGEIARLKHRVTVYGGWFDAVLDRYADAFLLFGLTWHVWLVYNAPWVFGIGFLAIIGSFVNSYTADKYDGLMKKRLNQIPHYFRVGRDVRLFLVFIGALLNQPLIVLLFIALLMNAENVRRIVVLFRAQRSEMNQLFARIREIIEGSLVPEDPIHSRNTLEWLLRFEPDADVALRIAAVGHDIDRAYGHSKTKRTDYDDYDAYKEAHALKSSELISTIMKKYQMSTELIDDVVSLIRSHETGGDSRSDLLRNADSVSFFDVNLPFYYERNSVDETIRRCVWGLKRLSVEAKEVVESLDYERELGEMVTRCAQECK